MTPQIEILFTPSEDGTQYLPIVASLEGFPWSDTERAEGVIGNCPDEIIGCDVDLLLATLTADSAPSQVSFPFKTTKQVQRGAKSYTRLDKKSSWVLSVDLIDLKYLFDDSTKPVMSADEVTSALVVL